MDRITKIHIHVIQKSGVDPGFQVRGAHLKKIATSGGMRENFGVFLVKNHDFTPKNHIFSNFRGKRRVLPPGSALESGVFILWNTKNVDI